MPNVIDYRDVTIHRNSLITLKHVDLKVGQGEFVYIIGKVGSGKSSLLVLCRCPGGIGKCVCAWP